MKKIFIILSIGLALTVILVTVTYLYSRSWQNALFIKPLYMIETNEKVVALTFDDGPSNTRTPAVLELLNQYNVTASFFMLGKNIEKHPEIAQSVYKQGHLLGNHSYNHPRLIFKSPTFIRDQIVKTDLLIKSSGQKDVKYFRPPYSSKFIILPLVLQTLNKKLVTGTYDPPSEYMMPYDAGNVAHEVIKNTEPGSIIYLHDGKKSDHDQFVKSVELIIIGLREKGYRFVRLDYTE